MTTRPWFLFSDNGVSVTVNNQPYIVNQSHPSFAAVKAAILAENWDVLPVLMNLRQAVVNFVNSAATTDPEFTLDGSFLVYQDKPFTKAVTDKILRMIKEGNPAKPLYNFLRKVRNNPLASAQDEALLFWVANGGMFTEDGDIVAYKAVRPDYLDIHSGTKSNKVGETVEMDRNEVDPDRNQECSVGLHFAAFSYANMFGGFERNASNGNHLMVIIVDPADIVSVPKDYHNQKGRTWRYKVVAEVTPDNILPTDKEVITKADIDKVDVLSIARREKIEKEIDRKNALLAKSDAEFRALTDTLDAIEKLGGRATIAQVDRFDTLGANIDSLKVEIDKLMHELAGEAYVPETTSVDDEDESFDNDWSRLTEDDEDEYYSW